MNKVYSLLFLVFFSATLSAQTLFTYGNNAVSKEEFLKAYNKNRTTVQDKKQSLRDYLELYSKFKLKVKDAEDMHLDTLTSIHQDVQNFRNQIEASYLNDNNMVDEMANEAFQRQQKDIHLLHFYAIITERMTAADSLSAYNAIQHAYNDLDNRKEKSADLVQNFTTNYTPARLGDVGYITAFSIPYQYENIAYALKPGEISKPYRTKTGWHFFMNAGERKGTGRWKIAQIFFAIPTHSSPEEIAIIKDKADSVYAAILNGSDFAELAKKYSQDRNTFMNGGQLPEFGTGKFDTTFEDQVFALKADSAVSKPFLTSFGYHIIKRLQHTTVPDKATDDYLDVLKEDVLKDQRAEVAKEKFMQDIAVKTNYNRNAAVTDADLIRYADSVVRNNKMDAYPISDSVIFSFTKQTVTGKDWLNYVHGHLSASLAQTGINKEFIDKYISETTLNYYKDHLEEYNTDFKYQMQEFEEGNLLFEIMQEKVWNKAASDSAGLLNYYDQHKEKYVWVKSGDLIIYNCSDKFAAIEVTNKLKNGETWEMIARESQGRIQADSNRYELSQIKVPDSTVLAEGTISAPLISMDNTASLVQVIKLFPANEQRSFADAKGMVTNDYQSQLEDEWVAALQKKYPVKINKKVFRSLLK